MVDSVAAWNNEEKREEVFTYIFTHLSRFDDFKRVQNNIKMLAPSKKFSGEPVKIEREMNNEEERAAKRLNVGDWRKSDRYWKQRKKPSH